MAAGRRERAFVLTGGALCLDFANTLGDRPRCHEERLGDYQDLLAWARQAGALPPSGAEALGREARRRPSLARIAFEGAVLLRERLYAIFAALARGRPPPRGELEGLNRTLAGALGRLRVVRRRDGFGWSWAEGTPSLERMLWPVARSAADLLTSEEAGLLRECASDDCSWLFVDRSRTRRRRWCNMLTCGNRNKARRHYRRLRARAAVSSRRSPKAPPG